MKNVVIFGASGHTGKYILKKALQTPDLKVSAFVRTPAKLNDVELGDTNVIQGDALNADDVVRAMDGQDVLICSLEGDVLTMAKNIVAALEKTSVKRILWITGMGIHGEITGLRGKMLGLLAKQRPEYIQAADLIVASPAVTTLLRCPGIVNGDNEVYYLTPEGEQPRNKNIDRAGIAKCMMDLIADETLGVNDSLAITN